jgi:hypothetical protein
MVCGPVVIMRVQTMLGVYEDTSLHISIFKIGKVKKIKVRKLRKHIL